MRGARKCRKRVFLELYAGAGVVTNNSRRRGYGAMSFEINNGCEYDLLHPCVHKLILGWIRSGVICGVFPGTQCSSWSIARHGPVGSAWGPLRSRSHILGLPNLNDKDQRKGDLGNNQMRNTAAIIDCCVALGVPCMLENPHNSRLWLAPPIARLSTKACCQKFVLDQCQFGARWRKRTAILAWHCGHDHLLIPVIPDLLWEERSL